MPMSLPSVVAGADHRTITLWELRELVACSEHLSDDTIVRGQTIPFHLPDLGNPLGGCLTSLALDEPANVPTPPNRAARRAAGKKR